MLAGLFVFGCLGTGTELLLLEHTEDLWQQLPIGLLAVGPVAMGALALRRAAAAVRVFQLVMALFMASGVIGIGLHLRGNLEFERELHPTARASETFWEALRGATPTLAPGAMILLGLLGSVYAYGHSREN